MPEPSLPQTPITLTRRTLLTALPIGLAPAWAVAQKAAPQPLPAVGAALPLAPAPLIGGGRFDPAQAQGKPVILYWWASWCPFCVQQSPEMQKLWAAQSGRGLQMLALSIDKKPEDAAAYLARKGYTFPAAWLGPDLAKAYAKPDGLPVTVVRGKDGRVVQAEKGQLFAEDVAELARWL